MSTPAEIATGVREHVVDSGTNKRYSETVLCRRVNQARDEISRDRLCVSADTTISLTAGTSSYTLPTKYVRMKTVWIDSDGDGTYNAKLEEVHFDDCEGVSSGTPTGWARWGDKLYLNFKPTSNITNGLKLYFYSLPDAIVLSSGSFPGTAPTLDVPAMYHSAVEYRAAEILLHIDEEPERARNVRDLYRGELLSITQREAQDSTTDSGYTEDNYDPLTGEWS